MKDLKLIGVRNFWRNLSYYQEIETDEQQNITTRLIKPVNRTVRRIEKIVDKWILLVGVTFGVFTLKILAETLVEHMR